MEIHAKLGHWAGRDKGVENWRRQRIVLIMDIRMRNDKGESRIEKVNVNMFQVPSS